METGKSISELIAEAGDKKVIVLMCGGVTTEKDTHAVIRHLMEAQQMKFEDIGILPVTVSAKQMFAEVKAIQSAQNIVVVLKEEDRQAFSVESNFEAQMKQNMDRLIENLRLTPVLPIVEEIQLQDFGMRRTPKHKPLPPAVKKGFVKPNFTLRGRHR